MKIDSKEIIEIIADFENGMIGCRELSDWAAAKIEKGIETKSLILLAGLLPHEIEDAKSLLRELVTNELRLEYPSKEAIELYYAQTIAKKILNKKIQPNEGCSLIGEINQVLSWPAALSDFGLLAHTQTDHESLGITKENIIPEIMTAAQKLANHEIAIRDSQQQNQGDGE